MASETADRLNRLIEEWPRRDGATGSELSAGFSECLVADDKLFFEVMNKHRDLFGEWLARIGNQTFTAFDPSQRTGLERLRKNMLMLARRRVENRRYGDLARVLASKLRRVKIRVVD